MAKQRMSRSERKEQIAKVAYDLFCKYGYRGTTTAQISKAADVSEPIIYKCGFEDGKLEIFLLLCEQHIESKEINGFTLQMFASRRLDNGIEKMVQKLYRKHGGKRLFLKKTSGMFK